MLTIQSLSCGKIKTPHIFATTKYGSSAIKNCNAKSSMLFRNFSRETLAFKLKNQTSHLRQYQEMAQPKIVDKEDDFELIASNRAFLKKLDKRLEHVSEKQVTSLLESMDTLDFQNAKENSILLHPDLPYVTMAALKRRYLNLEHGQKQVATILNFWSALKYHASPTDLKTMNLFDSDGKPNQDSVHLIKRTLVGIPDPYPPFSFLDGKKFDDFMNKMKLLPPSEQRFLFVPNLQPCYSRQLPDTISMAIMEQTTIFVFNRANHKDHRIIPSVGMMQAFLDTEFGQEAVRITPKIYLSTQKQIRECGVIDTRDMMMSFPDENGDNRCPSAADGYLAPWYDFSYHDFYHAIVTSAVGSFFRKKAIEMSDFVERLPNEYDAEQKRKLAAKISDLEFNLFRPQVRPTDCSDLEIFQRSIRAKLDENTYHPNLIKAVKEKVQSI